MATYHENKEFLECLNLNLLDEAIDYIKTSLPPEEVYDKEVLVEWALENGFVEEDE